jgi:hypothetical protein
MADSSTLTLAVVGHTNTGKTSLLRTLTRNPSFGQVDDQPGTTRHVEGARLLVSGRVAIQLYDTPGMEDSMALLDYMDQLAQRAHRLDGPERIRRFLESPESKKRFEQEARVLNKLLACDAGLYVVDVRDPVLSKHKDELALLASCARPLLPVLNFIHSEGQRSDEWRRALANLGLHASVEFDTVAPALDGEDQLYGKLALMMDTHAGVLADLRADVHRQRQARHQDALRLVAELLVDAAAYHLSCAPDGDAVGRATDELREKIRRREAACVKKLLACYNFRAADFPHHALPLKGERWGMDLFHPQALKDAGIQVSKGVVAGAAAGVTVDIFTAGLSMGAAALTGAVAGGLWQGAEHLGKRVMGRLRGYRELSVDDAVLRLLEIRQMRLVQALEARGHAAQAPIALQYDNDTASTQPSRKPSAIHEELAQARGQPQWSTLARHFEPGPKRDQAIRALAARI